MVTKATMKVTKVTMKVTKMTMYSHYGDHESH